jgi:isopenicillin-N N-acyltransferase-like protein
MDTSMKSHAFPYIEVSGTSYEMGYQHGAQASDLVHRYLLWIEKLTGKSRDLLCRNAMAFLPMMQSLSPSLVEEVRGLADGAGISFEEAVLCQARAEAARVHEGGCTAFAVTGAATADGQTLAGQNQDLEPEYADVAILLHAKPIDGRPRALIFTFAGQLGYSGMNEHGLAHFANALYGPTWSLGLPHYVLARVMLEKRTAAECVGLLREHRACSPANKVLCDGEGDITDVEIRPEGIVVFSDDDPDWRIHTNHYLTSEFASHETGQLPDSPPRLVRMRALVKEHWGSITVDTMKTILADHDGDPAGICRHGEVRMHSISGYIAEPAKGVLHVRRGHGCLGSWHAYEV